MEISIVIPIYNESKSISRLYTELVQVMNNLKKSYEIIFVDDGSSDESFVVQKDLSKNAKENSVDLVTVRFRKNFGKSAALQVGFKESKGDIIITMDGDLQDDPNEIPKFIEKINQGYDLVSGWKVNRKDPLTKIIPSKIFNHIVASMTGVKIHDFNCCFKAYRREVVDNLSIHGELHRFIPALVYAAGFKVTEIKVNHRPRIYGKSKYGFRRFSEGFFDLITVIFLTRFITKPLHFFGNFGLLSSLIGFSIITLLYIRKFIFGILIAQNQFLFLLSLLLVMVGFQFFFIGLLGELIIKINPENKEKYCIKEIMRT